MVVVRVMDIDWVTGSGDYVSLHVGTKNRGSCAQPSLCMLSGMHVTRSHRNTLGALVGSTM